MESDPFKTPPVLSDVISYTDWKFDLEMWKLYAKLENKRKGPAVYLSLSGEAKECLRVLNHVDIGKENGLDLIIATLDKHFLKDENTRAYIAFKEFYDFRRSSGDSISQFLVTFERLYHKLKEFKIREEVHFDVPEGVKAFFHLTAANISEENERLARATCSVMTYDNMKLCIQKMFAEPVMNGQKEDAPPIKSEPVFFGQSSRHRNHGQQNNNSSSNNKYGNRKLNPIAKDGKRWRCYKCGSEDHLVRFCPGKNKRQEESDAQPVHIILLHSNVDRALPTLLFESLGMAVLDTGCATGRLP